MALNVNLPEHLVTRLKDKFQFIWSDSFLPYLGVNLAAAVDRLYEANYPPLFRKLEENLKNWSNLRLSWLGRVNSVKMTLLPCILYLFRSLPIPIWWDQLKRFQSKILRFIWGAKGHRIAKGTLYRLYRHRRRGGVGLPNLLWYYQVVQLSQLSTIYSKSAHLDWINIERQAIPHCTLDFLLWCSPKSRPAIMVPTLSHSLVTWDSQLTLNLQLAPTLTPFPQPPISTR